MKIMKSLSLAALLMLPQAVAADDLYVAKVLYPREACAEIVSQEYSTGGEQPIQMLEILCKDANGKYTGFSDGWTTKGTLFGLGRIFSVDRFDYVPYEGDKLEVQL